MSTIQSKYTELITETLELKKENTELKKNLSAKDLQDKYTFDEAYGYMVSKDDGQRVCTSCLKSKDIVSPLQKYEDRWDCQFKGCEQSYSKQQHYNIEGLEAPRYNFDE